MRTQTAYNKQRAALSQIKELWANAKRYHWTSDKIDEERKKIYTETLKGVASHWVEYVRGYDHCLYDAIWQHVEFCYKIDGKWYTTHRKDSDKPYWGEIAEKTGNYSMKGNEMCHMWKGTEKPYTSIEICK